jgi:hypothetical protein
MEFMGIPINSITNGYTKPRNAELVDVLARPAGTKSRWAKNIGEMQLKESILTLQWWKALPPKTWESIAPAPIEGTFRAMDANDFEAVPVGPFMNFGQFGQGRIDLRVFFQSEYWVDGNGVGHCLTTMSHEYRCNVIRVLLIRAENLHIKILYLIVRMLREATIARDTDTFETLLRTAVPLMHLKDPYELMENTLLMKRLRELSPDAPELGDLILEELQRTDGE